MVQAAPDQLTTPLNNCLNFNKREKTSNLYNELLISNFEKRKLFLIRAGRRVSLWRPTFQKSKSFSLKKDKRLGAKNHQSQDKHLFQWKSDLLHFWENIRVSVQGVVSLGGHFASLCREFDFYEVKKIYHYFSKRKGKYFYTFNHFYSEKSSKRAK